MKTIPSLSYSQAAGFALFLAAGSLMAQTNVSNAEAWLAAAPVAPEFSVPKTKATWEKRRPEVRATLWELLGKLPPRPKVPNVTTCSCPRMFPGKPPPSSIATGTVANTTSARTS
jgi:hypothetical protein